MSSWEETVTRMHKNNRSLAEMSKRTGRSQDEIKTFLKVEVDVNGYVQRIIPEMIPFYKGIEDDHLQWSK